ncbi:MAG: DUF3775 domain-containing protein [Thioalkalivibrionaceae bacterium]
MIDVELLQDLVQSMQSFDGADDLQSDDEEIDAIDADIDLEAAALAADDHPMTRRIVAMIDTLDLEQRAELVALMWIGRGDFTAEEWDVAVEEALERGQEHTGAYLIGTPLVADYWREGASAMGLDLEE